MKILHVTSLGYLAGGTETGIALSATLFKDRGYKVRIFSSDARPDTTHFSDYEFKALSRQPFVLKILCRLFYPHSFFALRAVLKEYNPDVVVLHTMSEVSPSVLFLLKCYPTVMIVHGGEDFTRDLCLWTLPPRFFIDNRHTKESLTWVGWVHYTFHRLLTSRVYRLGFKNVDAFVSFSLFMQRELRKDDIESIYIPNFTSLFDQVPIDTTSKTLLYVGRLEDIKGVQYLLEALPAILVEHQSAHLVIAGEGSYKEALVQKARERNMTSHVRFVGQKTRTELGELYAQAALVYVPSVWPEIFGKVGIEAMSVGRPVIASNVGGIAEWLTDGEGGFLVPPGDSAAIARATNNLLSHTELLRDMSNKARTAAERFSIETHAAKMLELYTDLGVR